MLSISCIDVKVWLRGEDRKKKTERWKKKRAKTYDGAEKWT